MKSDPYLQAVLIYIALLITARTLQHFGVLYDVIFIYLVVMLGCAIPTYFEQRAYRKRKEKEKQDGI